MSNTADDTRIYQLGWGILSVGWGVAIVALAVLLVMFAQCDGSGPQGPPTCGMVWGAFILFFALPVAGGLELALGVFGWLAVEVDLRREALVALVVPAVAWGTWEGLAAGPFDSWGLFEPSPVAMFAVFGPALLVHVAAVGVALYRMGRTLS